MFSVLCRLSLPVGPFAGGSLCFWPFVLQPPGYLCVCAPHIYTAVAAGALTGAVRVGLGPLRCWGCLHFTLYKYA